MSKIPYSKSALSYNAQLQQLEERGLTILNRSKALHLLEYISYYRLSGYWYPLLSNKNNHTFKPGSNFETAFNLYCFDRELRKLILSELEKIEVAIRAKTIYILSHEHGPFWFQNPNLFKNPATLQATLKKIREEYGRSDEEFIVAFKNKYLDPLPPSWILMEITSFGSLSKLYSNLRPGKEKRAIANSFGLSDSVFQQWLHSIVYLRNLCAHHGRLWNKTLSIRPQIPLSPRKTWLHNKNGRNDRAWFVLCMIKFLLQTVNPSNRLASKIKILFEKYPNVDPAAMGFPSDWQAEQLWQ
ncbi:MAG TPA: Abi family protein [Daejeonella sp.]